MAITYPGQAMAAVMALVGYIPQLLQGVSSERACACCPSGLPTWFCCSSQWLNHLVVASVLRRFSVLHCQHRS